LVGREGIAELAQIWLDAPDRQRVADAADFIDDHLKHTPLHQAIPFGEFFIHWTPSISVIAKWQFDSTPI
jgi:hypothetical protein